MCAPPARLLSPAVTLQPLGLPVIYDAPVQQFMPERLLLYSLICGLRPERTLEIGTLYGGSTMIICAASTMSEGLGGSSAETRSCGSHRSIGVCWSTERR